MLRWRFVACLLVLALSAIVGWSTPEFSRIPEVGAHTLKFTLASPQRGEFQLQDRGSTLPKRLLFTLDLYYRHPALYGDNPDGWALATVQSAKFLRAPGQSDMRIAMDNAVAAPGHYVLDVMPDLRQTPEVKEQLGGALKTLGARYEARSGSLEDVARESQNETKTLTELLTAMAAISDEYYQQCKKSAAAAWSAAEREKIVAAANQATLPWRTRASELRERGVMREAAELAYVVCDIELRKIDVVANALRHEKAMPSCDAVDLRMRLANGECDLAKELLFHWASHLQRMLEQGATTNHDNPIDQETITAWNAALATAQAAWKDLLASRNLAWLQLQRQRAEESKDADAAIPALRKQTLLFLDQWQRGEIQQTLEVCLAAVSAATAKVAVVTDAGKEREFQQCIATVATQRDKLMTLLRQSCTQK